MIDTIQRAFAVQMIPIHEDVIHCTFVPVQYVIHCTFVPVQSSLLFRKDRLEKTTFYKQLLNGRV